MVGRAADKLEAAAAAAAVGTRAADKPEAAAAAVEQTTDWVAELQEPWAIGSGSFQVADKLMQVVAAEPSGETLLERVHCNPRQRDCN